MKIFFHYLVQIKLIKLGIQQTTTTENRII